MKKTKRIYLSGKITGLSDFEPEIMFEAAEYSARKIFARKYPNHRIEIINPIKIKHKENASWADFMLNDLAALFTCTDIYMLTNWKTSKGAKIERFTAKTLRMNVWYENYKSRKKKQLLNSYINSSMSDDESYAYEEGTIAPRFGESYQYGSKRV